MCVKSVTRTTQDPISLAICSFAARAGDTENLQNGFEDTSDSPGTVAIAFYNGLWAFDGW
ncbi:hypothetical protein C0Q70_18533 [Pomacea canaliculata]|uniref:Uncharacterized protein n=1 Tax=Pomacea canaliculata TaxID=400727 RepID=A0A2T7NGS7_POMCA|nr:hypothetical protein C0Q70_18533 [Pomacea canaliculata]